jgi:hypothetical protein
MRIRTFLLPAALALGLSLAAPGSGAADGFFLQQDLHLAANTSETSARGGVTSWFRVNPDRTTVQGIRVWVQGLSDSFGAAVWMAKPGTSATEEVATMADSANGSAVWEVVVNSRDQNKPPLPLKVESVLKLTGGKIEIRASDVVVLQGKVGDFDWGRLNLSGPGRTSTLLRAPPPGAVPDDAATGLVRLWRRRAKGNEQWALSIFAKGLTADETYEIWIEDGGGNLVTVDTLVSTADGLGFFNLDSRYDGALPSGIDVVKVGDLSRRRVELHKTGVSDFSLAGLFPRLR